MIVDDDRELCDMVVTFLNADGFSAKAVHSGAKALAALEKSVFEIMILDVMMPGMTGHEVMRQLAVRAGGILPIPVLMLTAKGDEIDRIVGLETGADDYLTKPCSLRELAARLRAILRRTAQSREQRLQGGPPVTVGEVSIDPGNQQVTLAGTPVNVTSTEFVILQLLMHSAGQPVRKETLTERALGREYTPYDRSIDVHIGNLRRKLANSSGAESPIKTIRGRGYLYALPSGAPPGA